jgi:hypothetical protein
MILLLVEMMNQSLAVASLMTSRAPGAYKIGILTPYGCSNRWRHEPEDETRPPLLLF